MQQRKDAHRAGCCTPAEALAPLRTAGAGPADVSLEVVAPLAAGHSEGRGIREADARDSRQDTASTQGAGLCAALRARGFGVLVVGTDFYVTRWDQAAVLPDLRALHAFAKRVGVAHG